MMFCLVLSLLVTALSADAVQQASEYDDLMNYYGKSVDFLITQNNTYEVEWQKCSGDPHGQGATRAASNNTLCWDFAGSQYDGENIYLWEDPIHHFKMEGRLESRQTNQTNRTDLRTAMNTIFIKRFSRGDSFNVTIGLSGTEVENSTYQFYPWGTTFDVNLHGNVSVSSSGGHSVQFAAGEYLYNIKKSGMYFSVTLENGDVSNLGGICGQLHTYTLYRSAHPALFDHALAVANNRLSRPFLVTKTHHVGAQKECWYYAQDGPIHGVFGDTDQYLTTYVSPPAKKSKSR